MIRRMGLSLLIAMAVAVGVPQVGTVAAGTTIEGTVKTGGAAAADAVVYIEHAPGTFAPGGPANMDQRSMKFTPHVLPILAGTTVKFLNSDSTQHNVFTPDFEKYNLGTWPQGESKSH